MDNILDGLLQQFGSETLSGMSQQLGVQPEQVQTGLQGALPFLLSALVRNTQSSQGAESLYNALSKDHDGSILNNVMDFLQNSDQGPGNGILKHLLGGQRGTVESLLSQFSGLDAQSAGKLLQMSAPILMGYLGKQQRDNNLNADDVAGLLRNTQQQAQQQQAQQVPNVDMLTRLLDADGDGSVTDDLSGMALKFLGGYFKR